jgi:hypothetical protein
MPADSQGWQLKVRRLGLQRFQGKTRTVGAYEVLINGEVQPRLSGMMLESIGPGDNKTPDNGKRIEQGSYPLWTQFGRYRSIGYTPDGGVAGQDPMPAIALAATGKRTAILVHPAHPPTLYLSSIGCLNPTRTLGGPDLADFWDSRKQVIDLIESLKAWCPSAFEYEVMRPIRGASIVITGEPDAFLAESQTLSLAETASLPISKTSALKCARWLTQHFDGKLRAAVQGKPYAMKHLCAIVCQETAYKWLPWIDSQSVQTIVERAVYDASGDYPGTERTAFPVDTAAFRGRFGSELTDMLIEEANKTRRMQNYSDKQWVYKGYGLFQYDLQAMLTDPDFFTRRGWYSFSTSLEKATGELDKKLIAQNGDLWEAIRAYNGRGARARQYAANVRIFTEYCAEVTGE